MSLSPSIRLFVAGCLLSSTVYARSALAEGSILLAAASPSSGNRTYSDSAVTTPNSSVVPSKGTIGAGASIVGGSSLLENGLNLDYWAADNIKLSGNLGFRWTENVSTTLSLAPGLEYYLIKSPSEPFGVFLGGSVGLNYVIPKQGDSTFKIALRLGGGAEYYFSRHFAVEIFEGINLSTKPTNIGLVTKVGFNWYF